MVKNFYRKVLKNGMVVLLEKRALPIISVAFGIRTGGMHEKKSEKGISHFIEHMLYKGTPTRNTNQIATEIEKNGGELNGFTDENVTAYWCKMPSQHLNIALEVLSDMLKNPLLDEKEMEKERKVIFEEIKMRKDQPRVYVLDKILSFLYRGNLEHPLIGTQESMNAINKKKMVEKFKQIYQPNNMILSVVGNADFDKIVKFAEKNFGNEKGELPKFKVELKNKSKVEKRIGIDQANMVLGYHVPLATDDKCYAALVLNALMAGGLSSRLFNEIREKRNLAYAVKGDSNINKDFAYNIVYVGTMKENVEKVKKLILKEFEKVSKSLSAKELAQAKTQVIGNHQIALEDSQTQMVNLLSYEIDGKTRDFYKFEEKIKAVKLQDVKNLAKIKNYSFFALVPAE